MFQKKQIREHIITLVHVFDLWLIYQNLNIKKENKNILKIWILFCKFALTKLKAQDFFVSMNKF